MMVSLKYALMVLGVVCVKTSLQMTMLELFVDSLISPKVGI